MLYLITGLSLGVIAASSRVPKFRWAPVAGSILLLATVFFNVPDLVLPTLSEAMALVLSSVLANALYAGHLWSRENIEPGVSYWGWVRRDITHPRYLLALYRELNSSKTPGVPSDREHIQS